MLPVSAEYPLVQYRQYDNYNPPAVPQIQIHPMCQHLLAPLASKVANMAGVLAGQNPARMFCYNLLGSNNWHNTEFNEVCKFAADLMYMLFTKQPTRTIDQYLEGAVENALRLKSSQYVAGFPELQNMCSAEVCRSSMDNLQLLPQLLSEIQYSYQQNTANTSVTLSPMQNMQGNVGQFSNRSGAIPSFYDGQNTGVQLGNNQQTVSLASLQTDRFANRNPGQISVQDTQPIVNFEKSKPLKLVIEPMTTEPSRDIKFSGASYNGNNVIKLIEDIRSSSTPTPIDLSAPLGNIEGEETKKSDFIKEEFVLENSLEDFILTGKIYYLENQLKTGTRSFYRVFGSIANGCIATDNFENLIDRWKINKTFRSLALAIKTDVHELKAHQDALQFNGMVAAMSWKINKTFRSLALAIKTDEHELKAHQDALQFNGMVAAMSQILTKAINNFLKFVLSTGIQIDSFIEDGEDLETYLQTKLTEPQFIVFQSWQKHFLMEFHNSESRVYEKALFILPERFNFYSMPTMISAAYIPVNKLEELNVSLKKGESTVVSEKQHPVIWELCRTIQFQREEFSADYSDDYIITADDERLQIFETIANGGQFIALKL